MKQRPRLSLLAAFLSFFVDNLSWSIVFPIFAPYFLDGQNLLFSSNVTMGERTTMLGLFLMAFSFGQFLGAPLIGDYADRFGRRKTLLLTIPCIFLGLVITALSLPHYNLLFLFIGRFITGVFASNGPVCLAAVSDLSKSRLEKSKNFGYFGAFAGASFVIGAFIGGKLSDKTLNPAFSFDLPLWVASVFCALNFLLVFFGFSETMRSHKRKPFSLLSSFQNIKSALDLKKVHNMYGVYFLFIFAWTILLQFTPVDVIHRYGFTSSGIGDLAFFIGVFWAVGSGQLKQWLLLVFSKSFTLKSFLFISAGLVAYVSYPENLYNMLAVLGAAVIAGGIIWPLCTSIISDLASERMQGKILSISQSIQSLAISIASVIGGMSFKWSLHAPFLIAACALAIGGASLWLHKNHDAA